MITICVYLALILVPLIILLVVRMRKAYSFFDERGVKHVIPQLRGNGNFFNLLLGKKNQIEIWEEFGKRFPDEPIIGFYNFTTPIILIHNADYIEKILIKDFTHFTDHGFEKLTEKTRNPFDESLFTMTGKRWRAFRYKLSPLFTTGKLKGMFLSMAGCNAGLTKHLNKRDSKNIDIKEASGLFSLDVIGSSIFGLETNVLENPDCEYHMYGKKAFDMTVWVFLKFIFLTLMPGFLIRFLGIQFNKPDVVDYFSKIVRDTLKYRRENKVQRNDLIQILLQLREKQTIEIQTWDPNDDYLKAEDVQDSTESFEITDEMITAQAFSFLIGGYDSLSYAILYTCFELTQNPEVQEKVRAEIMEKVKTHSGLNYEALKDMTYLENSVKEALRLHPVIPFLQRSCTKDYTFPNGYTILKGESLQIPMTRIHRNPAYYEDPDTFRPERFERPIKPGTYLVFGDGPRICLAMRYALLHTKLAVATLLMNYKLRLSPKVEVPFQLKPYSFFKQPKEKLIFELEPIEC